MHEANIEPDWVSGVSIGAINAAIIAGNPRRRRLATSRAFWERITERKIWAYTPDGDVFRKARNATSSWMTMMQGQPGFFTPRIPSPWLSFTGAQSATSYYDSAPLKETLKDLVDFSMINDKAIRFAVGAVNVLSGNFIYFDNDEEDDRTGARYGERRAAAGLADDEDRHGSFLGWRHRLQHAAAASARQDDSLNKLVFQVDLFSARGALPRDIQDVMARQKDIMYSSRTRYNTDVYRRIQKWKTPAMNGADEGPDGAAYRRGTSRCETSWQKCRR